MVNNKRRAVLEKYGQRRPGARFPRRILLCACLLLPLAGLFAGSAQAQTEVPANWDLVPSAIGTGDQFRLIFVSSTKRNSTSSTIGDYDSRVQTAAASGHTARIRSYSAQFKAWAARRRPMPATTPPGPRTPRVRQGRADLLR